MKPPEFQTTAGIRKECGDSFSVPVNLAVSGPYPYVKGSTHSVYSEQLFNQYLSVIGPIEDRVKEINALTESYLTEDNVNAGKCAVELIDEWARNDGLLGEMKTVDTPYQSYFSQKLTIAGLSAAYFRVQNLASKDEHVRISWWLSKAVESQKYFWRTTPNMTLNNHYVWAGVGAMQVGIITGDKENIKWAKRTFDHLVGTVNSRGFLFHETQRGNRALHYHEYAVIPMLYMVQLSKLIGEDWGDSPRFQLLVTTVVSAMYDPSLMQKENGHVQDLDRPFMWALFQLLEPNDPRQITADKVFKDRQVAWHKKPPFSVDRNSKEIYNWDLGGNQATFMSLIKNKLSARSL